MKNLLASSPSQQLKASNDYLLEQLEVARATVIKTKVLEAGQQTNGSLGRLPQEHTFIVVNRNTTEK
jgi:lipid-binding SYLF domain-containing protein